MYTHAMAHMHAHTHTQCTHHMCLRNIPKLLMHTKRFTIFINQTVALSYLNKWPGDQYWTEIKSIMWYDWLSSPFSTMVQWALEVHTPTFSSVHTATQHCYPQTAWCHRLGGVVLYHQPLYNVQRFATFLHRAVRRAKCTCVTLFK